jgi:hypothetical protein
VVQWDTGGGGTNYCSECRFLGGGGGAEEYCLVDGDSTAVFVDCVFENADVSDSTFRTDTTGGVRLVGCELSGYVQVDDGDFDARKCSFTTDDQTTTISVLAVVSFYLQDCVVLNTGSGYCLGFSAELTDVVLLGNRFSASGGSYDIASTSTIVGAQVKGNSMAKGMDGNISTASLERWSTGQAGDCDYYAGIFDAWAAVDQNGVIIRMLDDETIDSNLPMPAYDTVLDLNGNLLAHSSPENLILAVDTGGVSLIVCNGSIDGYINHKNNPVFLMHNITLFGAIISTATWTGKTTIDRCSIVPAVRTYCFRFGGDGGTLIIRRSFMQAKPGVDSGALRCEGGSPTGVFAKYSTFSNGDGVNEPFKRSAAETMQGCFYQCGFNAALPAWVTNNIAAGQEQTSVDVNTAFQ